MTDKHGNREPVFRVIDAMDAPHGGRIIRLRVLEGQPTVKALKGATLKAVSPRDGTERLLRVRDFAILGGRPSDRRIADTKHCDLIVDDVTPHGGTNAKVDIGWQLRFTLPPSPAAPSRRSPGTSSGTPPLRPDARAPTAPAPPGTRPRGR